jgi:hypothetical protein
MRRRQGGHFGVHVVEHHLIDPDRGTGTGRIAPLPTDNGGILAVAPPPDRAIVLGTDPLSRAVQIVPMVEDTVADSWSFPDPDRCDRQLLLRPA